MGLMDVLAWLEINNKELSGRRSSNFYFDRDSGIVIVKLQGMDRVLVIEGGKRIHLSSRVKPPSTFRPHPLVVLLRKNLRGKRISNVDLATSDRIVRISYPSGHSIIAELVPRGVVVLVDENMKVLASDKTLKVKDRVIRPGTPYVPPPPRDSLLYYIAKNQGPVSGGQVKNCARTGRDLVRGLIRGCGVQGEVAEEAIYRAGLSPDMKPESIGTSLFERIIEELLIIWDESRRGAGFLVKKDSVPVEAVPFRPRRYEEEGYDIITYKSFDEALDELFAHGPLTKSLERESVDPELARLLESIRKAEDRARLYREEAEKLRVLADVVSRNFDKMSRLLAEANMGRRASSGRVIVEPRGDKVLVFLGDVRVEVPRGAGPERVVVELYRMAGELDAKADRALRVKDEINVRLEELRIKAEAREIARRAARRRRYWYEKFHWTRTRKGLLAIGGRDAGQNETVVKKYLSRGDIFLHANIHGAPAVVLKTRGREPSSEDLYDAAVITAAYSRAWKAGAGSIEVYWVRDDQVSFSPPSGEYLARGGIMVYGRKNYLPRPVPVRLALGIAVNEEQVPVVVQGSEETISEIALAYVILAPGDMGKEETAEAIRRELAAILGRDKAPLVYAVRAEEIMPRIPGKARILRVKLGAGKGINMRLLADEEQGYISESI